jgi:hypothetical protein
MAALHRFLGLARALRHDERGIAVPTAMMALIASFGLASVAVMSTVDVQQGTQRDHDSKEAIAAADAGANIALLRLNRFLPYLSTTHPCVGPGGEYQTPTAGWCPSTATEPVGGASYSYRVSAFTEGGAVEVVAVGASGTVSRRVNVKLLAGTPKNIFAKERLIGQDRIEIDGTDTRIDTDFGTNGDIVTSGNPTLCGNARHGIGKDGPTPSCGKQKTEGNQSLPPIAPPSNIATVNDNCRLSQTCTGEKAGQVDIYSKKLTKNNPWVSEIRKIDVASKEHLTMGGAIYWVCQVEIQGTLYMPAKTAVQIFVDTPEHCGLKPGAVQVNIGSQARVESSFDPNQGIFEIPAIYVLGDGAVKMDGAPESDNEVMIYAPYSEIDLGGKANWVGMLAGRTLKIHGNPKVRSDPNLKLPEINVASIFQRTRYVECTGAVASPPNASC